MDYFDFFHPPFSSLATIVANGLSVNQILLRRSPPKKNKNKHPMPSSMGVIKPCLLFKKMIKQLLTVVNVLLAT